MPVVWKGRVKEGMGRRERLAISAHEELGVDDLCPLIAPLLVEMLQLNLFHMRRQGT
jgi:hypothetical protein